MLLDNGNLVIRDALDSIIWQSFGHPTDTWLPGGKVGYNKLTNGRDSIIHCDIKPENILSDAEYNPWAADLGVAKIMGRDFSRVLTTIRGTGERLPSTRMDFR
ncbi:S-LOCUS LECTIN KINASE FAMILY PROTEIN [Salix purpurea]|uniref:S-LOCUS LECTIN KINASE FAMILY PROTEIN n=1 Tax=Salix purpurea TaxID=77065 RepID=A0A9Q0ZNV7_SALPP|nr:S-LOCUS LECTIN KINASE FAMILY PROTEIN [Salix purpurea]